MMNVKNKVIYKLKCKNINLYKKRFWNEFFSGSRFAISIVCLSLPLVMWFVQKDILISIIWSFLFIVVFIHNLIYSHLSVKIIVQTIQFENDVVNFEYLYFDEKIVESIAIFNRNIKLVKTKKFFEFPSYILFKKSDVRKIYCRTTIGGLNYLELKNMYDEILKIE